MAVGTVAAITGGMGLLSSGASIIGGLNQKKKAKAELNSYERQDLLNAAESIEISTLGTDLMREESQRTVANIVDALQGGGSRVLGASLPQLQAGINQTNRQIQADLDQQVINREYAIANEEAQLRGIREQRDNQNIGALQSQYMAGEQNVWNGITGAIASAGSLDGAIGDKQPEQREMQTSLSKSITPKSQTYYNPFDGITPFTLPAVNTLFTENQMKPNQNLI